MSHAGTPYPTLTDDLRKRFIEQVATTVRARYVFEDPANAMADHILEQLAAHAFDEIASIPALAARLTHELHGVHEDLHLYIDPWLPKGDESDAGNLHEDMLRNKHRTNFDFRKIEVLLGNVGYLDLRGFCPVRMSGETAAAAMRFLAHADALIFDLRNNGGGEDLVQFLQSYLFAEPTHMITQRHRSGRTKQTWTHPYVPGPKFIDQPVYILTSRSSFSAAEDFSFTLQRQGRAIVVGEPTRGGAHPVEFHRFADLYLEIMIPEESSEDPATGENWEDSGVAPDIATPASEALRQAHEEALRTLLDRPEADESLVRFRRWALESVQAQASRPTLSETDLAIYPGQYGRSIRVFLDGRRLKLNWGNRQDHVLVPLREHAFEYADGFERAEFTVENGTPTELIGRDQDGGEWRLPRAS